VLQQRRFQSCIGAASDDTPNKTMAENEKEIKKAYAAATAKVPPGVTVPARNYGFPPEAFDWSRLPDVETNFLSPEHLEAFIQALAAPDPVQSPSSSSLQLNSPSLHRSSSSFFPDSPTHDTPQSVAAAAAAAAADMAGSRPPVRSNSGMFITAQSDWAPVHEKVLSSSATNGSSKRGERRRTRATAGGGKKKLRKPPRMPLESLIGSRSKDETREGYLYSLLKWPFLLIVGTWIMGLSVMYLATRFYIYLYEQGVAWRGKREKLRRAMRATGNYKEWVAAAKNMDEFFGNGRWKEENEFAYYDSKTVRKVWDQMRKCREQAEKVERKGDEGGEENRRPVEDLKALVEACVKNNFVGIENPRLYSQTYYGTKNLVQNYVDEGKRNCSIFGSCEKKLTS